MVRTVFHLAGDDPGGVATALLAFAAADVAFAQRFVLWPVPGSAPLPSDWLRAAGAAVAPPVPGRFSKVRTYRALMRAPGACAVAHVDSDVVWLHLARRLGLLPRGVRVVALRHNTGQLLRDRPPAWFGVWARLLVRGYRRADAVVGVGPDVVRDLAALGIRSVELRNPVDVGGLARLPAPARAATFLFMGRLNAPGAGVYKDAATVIRALSLTARQDLRLVVAGDGPMREPYEASVRALGLGARVDFLGWTDALGALERADAVILSSVGAEGYPLAGAEAAAAGRLLLFSAGPGMEAFAEVGHPFPPQDARALAGAMDALAALGPDEVRGESARGRRWAAEHHDPARWARRWSGLIAGL